MKGFEEVVRRHFYLKKKEILEECQSWLKLASTKPANYDGCQNANWAKIFREKNGYPTKLAEIIKELEAALDLIPTPSDSGIKKKISTKKASPRKAAKAESKSTHHEEIDVSYDPEVKHKEMNIEDAAVKDRWSRYIGAMGIEAVARQANSSIFLSGLGALGVEIAKNIVLSGVKRFTMHDDKKVSMLDLSGQFYLTEEDIGKNRAESSLLKIQQLNAYVKVDTKGLGEALPDNEEGLNKLGLDGYNVVIVLGGDRKTLLAVDEYCRKKKIVFISGDCCGVFSRVFCDYGEEYIVNDKNGEEPQDLLIKSISNEENGLVTLMDNVKHRLEDGDEIEIREVEGMKRVGQEGSINGEKFKVKIENYKSFRIGDTRGFETYNHNGRVREIKSPFKMHFDSMEKVFSKPNDYIDANLLVYDFVKTENHFASHLIFEVCEEFKSAHSRSWKLHDLSDLKLAQEILQKHLDKNEIKEDSQKNIKKLFIQFWACEQGTFGPLAAFLGGWISQEIVKAITRKFIPTKQMFYFDCAELMPVLESDPEKLQENLKDLSLRNDRYDGLRLCLGNDAFQEISKSKLFMVGVGAIGCELLKNFAMIGAGTQGEGQIVITDPDVIESSNLNRQFLFREKHIRKSKAKTAAAAILLMNKQLSGHLTARVDKVHQGTEDIFDDEFFETQTVVTNALDNVQARRYIDIRCVKAKTPLLESGTLGSKGHVQTIIPFKTESYNSQQDPQEDNEIPYCTLKMFPEETLHCVEWARDKFSKLFTSGPKSLVKILEDPNTHPTNLQDLKAFKDGVKLLKKRPMNFDDCVTYARNKFQKYFVNDIKQLLHTYPLNSMTKQGTPFWSSPKRPPVELIFDPTNKFHRDFIAACACLRAVIFKIPIPAEARKENLKAGLAQEASLVKVKEFKPSEEKSSALASEVDKSLKKNEDANNEEVKENETSSEAEIENVINEFKSLISNLDKQSDGSLVPLAKAEEFEKDDDSNFHIDLISAMANCRALNYKLEPMDWLQVKLKAGKIVPALATTTASIAGLQTIELCKILKKSRIEDMRNTFLNFAVPMMSSSEPGAPKAYQLTEKLKVTLWDRLEIKGERSLTLENLFKKLLENYELEAKDVFHGQKPIYVEKIMGQENNKEQKEKILKDSLVNILEIEEKEKYVDLMVTFSKKGESEILKNTPDLRVNFF